MDGDKEVVLVTGASGFLGQHLVKHLMIDDKVSTIRMLDKVPFHNHLGYIESKKIQIFQRNLLDPESCREAVKNAHAVFHCAALVCYEFPPKTEELYKNNLTATENLIKLCLEEDVERLIYCSTTEVTLQPYFKGGIVAFVIYGQESRLNTTDEGQLIFGEYAASKLKAEELVLSFNGTNLKSGQGTLRTVSLRPPLLYGERDNGCIAKMLDYARNRKNYLPKLAGVGGKQQTAYVGNIAWALICAKNTLKKQPQAIAGLSVIVTDDTPVEDLTRFCERITRDTKYRVILSRAIPIGVSYLVAYFVELLVKYIRPSKLPVSPRSMIAYLGSLIIYNRTRASISMDYSPIYTPEKALAIATEYYCNQVPDC
ncbi:3 beta-hydroxysteroid dehydrogenase/Delta 5--_4-isomerase type 4 [Orussus abietinus]|uniref:3 beta-hydroxysteroid dehydrogenase/Delta 5-->4-isomerase type 4 n=1 Tax=Orussus abietinus TaxID=222816 RepID=UPI000C715C0C|nr:3 beta-hydroxysteroid dehydrogenase/Delta 5-->4-isomerase type 4 [Orussus abietinus]